MEGPSSFAAIILESVPGTAGIMVPPPGYMAGVREICDRYGIVFIADEVMAGFGRTGKWFAIDHFDVVPDLMTFAKGVTSGYVPLGGVAINDAIAATFADRAYPGGLTYSGHPLATACAVATINAMEDEGMVTNAARIGEKVLGPGLRELAARHPSVGEVRGLGVFWALDLVSNQQTREPLAPYGGSSPAMAAVLACMQVGRDVAVLELQPHPRGAAVQCDRRRGGRGSADSRRRTDGGRRLRQLIHARNGIPCPHRSRLTTGNSISAVRPRCRRRADHQLTAPRRSDPTRPVRSQ